MLRGERHRVAPVGEVRIALRVQPGAKASQVVGLVDGVLRVRVAAPATEGKANRALVDLLAGLLRVPKTRVRILWGAVSRDKVVEVEGISTEEALRRLLA